MVYEYEKSLRLFRTDNRTIVRVLSLLLLLFIGVSERERVYVSQYLQEEG